MKSEPGGFGSGGSETGGLQIPEMKSTMTPTATSRMKQPLASATLATGDDRVVIPSSGVSQDVGGKRPATTARNALKEAPPDEELGTRGGGVVGTEDDEANCSVQTGICPVPGNIGDAGGGSEDGEGGNGGKGFVKAEIVR